MLRAIRNVSIMLCFSVVGCVDRVFVELNASIPSWSYAFPWVFQACTVRPGKRMLALFVVGALLTGCGGGGGSNSSSLPSTTTITSQATGPTLNIITGNQSMGSDMSHNPAYPVLAMQNAAPDGTPYTYGFYAAVPSSSSPTVPSILTYRPTNSLDRITVWFDSVGRVIGISQDYNSIGFAFTYPTGMTINEYVVSGIGVGYGNNVTESLAAIGTIQNGTVKWESGGNVPGTSSTIKYVRAQFVSATQKSPETRYTNVLKFRSRQAVAPWAKGIALAAFGGILLINMPVAMSIGLATVGIAALAGANTWVATAAFQNQALTNIEKSLNNGSAIDGGSETENQAFPPAGGGGSSGDGSSSGNSGGCSSTRHVQDGEPAIPAC